MNEVLKALQELDVSWKKIGHYNMKCRWVPGFSGHAPINNSLHGNHSFGNESAIVDANDLKPSQDVKFEIQVIGAVSRTIVNRILFIRLFLLLSWAQCRLIFTCGVALQDEGREVSSRLAEGEWPTAALSRSVCSLPGPAQGPLIVMGAFLCIAQGTLTIGTVHVKYATESLCTWAVTTPSFSGLTHAPGR